MRKKVVKSCNFYGQITISQIRSEIMHEHKGPSSPHKVVLTVAGQQCISLFASINDNLSRWTKINRWKLCMACRKCPRGRIKSRRLCHFKNAFLSFPPFVMLNECGKIIIQGKSQPAGVGGGGGDAFFGLNKRRHIHLIRCTICICLAELVVACATHNRVSH